MQIWIAESVLTGEDTTLMVRGYEYINELVNKCLIDWYAFPSMFVAWKIKVHDVLRDMAIRIGESEEHCLFATN